LLTGVVREQRDRAQTRRQVKRMAVWAGMTLGFAIVLVAIRYKTVIEQQQREFEKYQHQQQEDEAKKDNVELTERLNIEEGLRSDANQKAEEASREKKKAEQNAAAADRQKKIAISARTAARALNRLQDQPDLAPLLAVESAQDRSTPDSRPSPFTTLHTAPTPP